MKTAIYLGSFNPFHNDHLKLIRMALDDFGMEKIIIVPTMQNPWKKDKVLDIDKRINIIWESLPVDVLINSLVEDIECDLTPPYYSYATLHALKNKYCNDELFILCGEDTIKDIPNWMNGEQILKDYNFLVIERPVNSISSSEVRYKLRKGMDISNLVSKNVINLIKKYYKL